jgi:hypothetical protein
LLWAGSLLAIDSVATINEAAITQADATRAGYSDLTELLAVLDSYEGTLYRIDVHHAGPDPRIALRENAALTEADVAEVRTRLARLDAAAKNGAWTEATLRLIEARPATLASRLAAALGEPDVPRFKTRVRKLKALGLTESLGVGYRLSPRGEAYLHSLS